MLQSGRIITVTHPCDCILTCNCNTQTWRFTKGFADHWCFFCTHSCVQFCVPFTFGCHGCLCFSSSFGYYIPFAPWFLIMYNVQVSLSRLCPINFFLHLECVCKHIVAVLGHLYVQFWVICLFLELPPIQNHSKLSFHALAPTIGIRDA